LDGRHGQRNPWKATTIALKSWDYAQPTSLGYFETMGFCMAKSLEDPAFDIRLLTVRWEIE